MRSRDNSSPARTCVTLGWRRRKGKERPRGWIRHLFFRRAIAVVRRPDHHEASGRAPQAADQRSARGTAVAIGASQRLTATRHRFRVTPGVPMPNAMMRTPLALLLATLVVPLVSPRVANAQQAFPADSAVLSIIKQRVEEKRSAGIVVGILEPDGRTRVIAFGDPGPGQPPLDGNTVFEIGSISKVFTATVLAELVKEGKVKLEDPVQKYLPSSVHLPTRSEKQITLGNLSKQNSGLPRMPSNFHPKDPSNPYADYSVQQMYDFVSGYQLTRDPGTLFENSNLGVGLLGHALSLSTGQSYDQMERKRVWEPLKMTNTAITLTPWMKQ